MSGKFSFWALMVVSTAVLSACVAGSSDRDYGVDEGVLLEGRTAGLWIDGNGCDHWILDDGFEGYMSPRLTEDGKPVCRVGAVPYTTIDFERSLFGE